MQHKDGGYEGSNEARVIMERSKQLQAVDQDVLFYNDDNFSNFEMMFSNQVYRRSGKTLG